MAGDVESAWIAASASLVVSIATAIGTAIQAWRTQRAQDEAAQQLAVLTSKLSDENDAAKARRDYEYEARKRLYADLYPLAYQLQQAALHAEHRIKNLALAASGGWLADNADNWLMGRDTYYFTALVYALIAPLATHALIIRKLTQLDLALDQNLNRLHVIAYRACEAMSCDFELVGTHYPPIDFGPGVKGYLPPEEPPKAMPPEPEQRWQWRQGLYSGLVSQAIEAVLLSHGDAARVMSYAEFAQTLNGVDLRADTQPHGKAAELKKALQPLTDMLRDFHPARRPVTWRILLAQGACYRAISAVRNGETTLNDIMGASQYARADAEERARFDWIGDGKLSIPPALRDLTDFGKEQADALDTADAYIAHALTDIACAR